MRLIQLFVNIFSLFWIYLILLANFYHSLSIRYPKCCNLLIGNPTCQKACEQVTLSLSVETRYQKLSNVHALCPDNKVFWTCMNTIINATNQAYGWLGWPCCNLAINQNCFLSCVTSTSKSLVSKNCRPSDEITFYQCLKKQEEGEICCSNAANEECRHACWRIFKKESSPTADDNLFVQRKCGQSNKHVLRCIQNYTKTTPARNPAENLKCCHESSNETCRKKCREILLNSTTEQEIVDKLIENCGQALPNNAMWQCFIRNSEVNRHDPNREIKSQSLFMNGDEEDESFESDYTVMLDPKAEKRKNSFVDGRNDNQNGNNNYNNAAAKYSDDWENGEENLNDAEFADSLLSDDDIYNTRHHYHPTSKLDIAGLDAVKLQCCSKAVTQTCLDLCYKSYSLEANGNWNEFSENCQYNPIEANLIACISEVDEPCTLGCTQHLPFCGHLFNHRPLDMFRSCKPASDRAAQELMHSWYTASSLSLPSLDIPILNIKSCNPQHWRTIACVLEIKPCHPVSHTTLICRSDCLEILGKCINKDKLLPGQTPEILCNILSPIDNHQPCIHVAEYMNSSAYIRAEKAFNPDYNSLSPSLSNNYFDFSLSQNQMPSDAGDEVRDNSILQTLYSHITSADNTKDTNLQFLLNNYPFGNQQFGSPNFLYQSKSVHQQAHILSELLGWPLTTPKYSHLLSVFWDEIMQSNVQDGQCPSSNADSSKMCGKDFVCDQMQSKFRCASNNIIEDKSTLSFNILSLPFSKQCMHSVSINREINQQPDAKKQSNSCHYGCTLGEVSTYIVPHGTFVQLPIPHSHDKSSSCHRVCKCSSTLNRKNELLRCHQIPCVGINHCWVDESIKPHLSQFAMGCNFCVCYNGKVICTKRYCPSIFWSETQKNAYTGLPCNCPMHYIPVCATNGKTYASACLAKCAGFNEESYEFGACPSAGSVELASVCLPLNTQEFSGDIKSIRTIDVCGNGYILNNNGSFSSGQDHKTQCIPIRRICLSSSKTNLRYMASRNKKGFELFTTLPNLGNLDQDTKLHDGIINTPHQSKIGESNKNYKQHSEKSEFLGSREHDHYEHSIPLSTCPQYLCVNKDLDCDDPVHHGGEICQTFGGSVGLLTKRSESAHTLKAINDMYMNKPAEQKYKPKCLKRISPSMLDTISELIEHIAMDSSNSDNNFPITKSSNNHNKEGLIIYEVRRLAVTKENLQNIILSSKNDPFSPNVSVLFPELLEKIAFFSNTQNPKSVLLNNYNYYYIDITGKLPICGYDGETYMDECEAASYGIQMDYRGPCRTIGSNVSPLITNSLNIQTNIENPYPTKENIAVNPFFDNRQRADSMAGDYINKIFDTFDSFESICPEKDIECLQEGKNLFTFADNTIPSHNVAKNKVWYGSIGYTEKNINADKRKSNFIKMTCIGPVPPGACCPMCGAQIRVLYSVETANMIASQTEYGVITVDRIVSALGRHLRTGNMCALSGYLSSERDLILHLTPVFDESIYTYIEKRMDEFKNRPHKESVPPTFQSSIFGDSIQHGSNSHEKDMSHFRFDNDNQDGVTILKHSIVAKDLPVQWREVLELLNQNSNSPNRGKKQDVLKETWKSASKKQVGNLKAKWDATSQEYVYPDGLYEFLEFNGNTFLGTSLPQQGSLGYGKAGTLDFLRMNVGEIKQSFMALHSLDAHANPNTLLKLIINEKNNVSSLLNFESQFQQQNNKTRKSNRNGQQQRQNLMTIQTVLPISRIHVEMCNREAKRLATLIQSYDPTLVSEIPLSILVGARVQTSYSTLRVINSGTQFYVVSTLFYILYHILIYKIIYKII